MGTLVIAGGGVGGLTLAAALQAQGRDVIIFERRNDAFAGAGTAISLWPNALAALDALDLGDPIRGVGRQLASMTAVKLNGRPAVTISSQTFKAALGEGLVCVHRGELLSTLAARLLPGTVRRGQAVSGYAVVSGGVRVELQSGGSIQADGLIGADGIRSTVATQLGGPFQFSYSGYTAWRGLAGMDTDPGGDQIGGCFAHGHEFGWLPLRDGRSYWFATAWLAQGQDLPEGEQRYIEQTFRDWPEPVPSLLDSTPAEDLLRNDIVDRSAPRHWSSGPVTLLGDAAHPMRPHLGQGGCQAIEDAVCLSACLAREADPASAFVIYERLRRRRARLMVRRSIRAGVTFPLGWRTRIFDAALRVTPRLPVLRPEMRIVGGMVGYRAGARVSTA